MASTNLPNGRLAGRNILITGASSGIGRATAELFAREGARLALLDIDAGELDAIATQIGATGIRADVASESSVRQAVELAASALGGIDGVVNCAGIISFTPLDTARLSDWQRILDVNLTGAFLVSRAALPWLRKAEHATIVNVSSNQGLMPGPRLGAYAASKAGLLALSKSLAMELGPKIRVNSVCPGTVDTPMTAANIASAGVDVSRYVIPRVGQALEIASGILYLTGSESSYVTGIALAIDGGRTFH